MAFSRSFKASDGRAVEVRTATAEDAESVRSIWNSVIGEKIYSVGLNVIGMDEEKAFIGGLAGRETILVAVLEGRTVGYTLLAIPEKECMSTSHVAELGTWVLKDFRGMDIGHFLITSAFDFAKLNGFEKAMVKVRSSNQPGLGFYRSHGFVEVGRLKKQIKIDGKYDDHVIFEKLFG